MSSKEEVMGLFVSPVSHNGRLSFKWVWPHEYLVLLVRTGEYLVGLC